MASPCTSKATAFESKRVDNKAKPVLAAKHKTLTGTPIQERILNHTFCARQEALKSVHIKATAWLRRPISGLSPQRPVSIQVRFVVNEVALRHVSLRVLQFPPSISFHRGSPCSYITWEMNNRPIGGRSSEM
jgi:hypothetical protein